MSLIAWYQFNDNCNDSIGNYHASVTSGAIVYENARFNKCASLTTDDVITYPNTLINSSFKSISITFWANILASTTTRLFESVDSSSYRNIMIHLLYSNGNTYWDCGHMGSSYDRIYQANPSPSILTQWHHWGFTKDFTTGKMDVYLDGNLWLSSIGTPTRTFTDSNVISTYNINGKISDLRIYDHVLSTLDVQEIYRSKILHYNFNEYEEPTTNLLNGELYAIWSYWGGMTGSSTYFTTPNGHQGVYLETLTSGGVNWYNTGSRKDCTPSTQYTISAIVKYEGGAISGNLFYLRQYRSDTTQISEGGLFNTSYMISLGNNWFLAYRTFTTHAECVSFLIHGYEYAALRRIWIYDIQVEQKSYYTKFNNNNRTATLFDSSGYNNHIDIPVSVTPQWIEDSKLGTGCYYFNGNGPYLPIDVNLTNTNNYPEGCTYSFWLNADVDSADRVGLLYGSPTICHIEIYTASKYFRSEARLQNGYSFGTGIFPDDVLGKWSHFAIVFANNETNRPVRWYQNGVLFHTGSLDGGTYPGTEYFYFNSLGRAAYTTSFKGKIDDLRVYASALTDTDIYDLYSRRACIDEQGKIYSFYVKENRDNYDIIENNNNLIENGNCEYQNNYNFSTSFSYNSSENCFTCTSGSNSILSDNFIEIYNPYDLYSLECEIKKGDEIGLRFYAGHACYDETKNYISHYLAAFYTNTYTTLAADLNNGDSVVYLTSATGWNNTNPGSTNYTKWFVLWPKNNVTYPAYTYTKITQYYINVDTITNTITLHGTWNGGYIPAGSWCCNAYSGSTYNYSLAGNPIAPDNWTRYQANIVEYKGSNVDQAFRTGTKYVKKLYLFNRANGDFTYGTTMFRNIKLINKTRTQNIQLLNHTMNVADNYLNTAKIDEIGCADRLVNWFPFNNDFHDYASNVDASVIGNVTLINDNGTYCANFDGTTTTYLQYLTGRLYEIPNLYQEWTVCAWFKTSDVTKTEQRLNTFNVNNRIIHTSGRMLMYLNSGSNDYYTYSNSGIFTNNTWYHVAFVFRNMGALRKLYVNGIDVSGTTLVNITCTPYGIQSTTAIGYNLLGQLRDYRVYDSALTSEEINQIYKLSNLSNKELQITSNYSIHTPKLIETL